MGVLPRPVSSLFFWHSGVGSGWVGRTFPHFGHVSIHERISGTRQRQASLDRWSSELRVGRRRGADARHAAHAGPARHVQLGPGRKSVSRMQAMIVQTSEAAVRESAECRKFAVGKRVDEMSVSLGPPAEVGGWVGDFAHFGAPKAAGWRGYFALSAKLGWLREYLVLDTTVRRTGGRIVSQCSGVVTYVCGSLAYGRYEDTRD